MPRAVQWPAGAGPAQAEERRLQEIATYATELEEALEGARHQELLWTHQEAVLAHQQLEQTHKNQMWTRIMRHRRWRGRLQFLANAADTEEGAIKRSFLRVEAWSSPVMQRRHQLCASVQDEKPAGGRQTDETDDSGTDAICRNLFASVSSTHRSEIIKMLTLLEQPERKGPADVELESAKRQLLAALALLSDQSASCPRVSHVRCSPAAIGTIVGKRGANIKRIGAQLGCTVVFDPKLQCFTVDGDVEATQRAKVELLKLETSFNRDQAHWAKEKARRRAEKLSQRQGEKMPKSLDEDLYFPEHKEELTALWHRHRRGREKTAKRRRQPIVVDHTRFSAVPGGWRPTAKVDVGGARALKRLLRWQYRSKHKRPSRGANASMQVLAHMELKTKHANSQRHQPADPEFGIQSENKRCLELRVCSAPAAA